MSSLSRVEPTATPTLGEDEIEAIVARLRQGEPLDDRYRARLFREPKESELVYAGKESRGAILAQTMAVPIQTLKRFGDSSGGRKGRTFTATPLVGSHSASQAAGRRRE